MSEPFDYERYPYRRLYAFCKTCHGTGMRPGSDYLDCGDCLAATIIGMHERAIRYPAEHQRWMDDVAAEFEAAIAA